MTLEKAPRFVVINQLTGLRNPYLLTRGHVSISNFYLIMDFKLFLFIGLFCFLNINQNFAQVIQNDIILFTSNGKSMEQKGSIEVKKIPELQLIKVNVDASYKDHIQLAVYDVHVGKVLYYNHRVKTGDLTIKVQDFLLKKCTVVIVVNGEKFVR